MRFDFRLFDHINGLAGSLSWLDALGRYLAVYGLLLLLLLVLGVAWWPTLANESRWRYLGALLAGLATCTLLAGLELFIFRHNELRGRPVNVRWVTLLVTGESFLSFPSWPVVYAWVLMPPTLRVSRRAGSVLAALGALLAMAMVFVGLNYPLDVLVGGLLGATVGQTFTLVFRVPPATLKRPWLGITLAWGVLLLLGGLLRILMSPASAVPTGHIVVPGSAFRVRVEVPPAVRGALEQAVAPAGVQIEAATNSHLLVASIHLRVDNSTYALASVEDSARRAVNCTFAGWRQLDLLTVTVITAFPGNKGVKLGTLYTATVERQQWPPAGFPSAQALPGRKFFYRGFYTKPTPPPSGSAISPDQR